MTVKIFYLDDVSESFKFSTNHYEGHKRYSMTRCLQRDLGGNMTS